MHELTSRTQSIFETEDPKNTNVFQPSLQVRGGEVREVADRGESDKRLCRVQNEVAPPIFPHLRPDLQYPEVGGGRLEEGGYYYDPRHASRCI